MSDTSDDSDCEWDEIETGEDSFECLFCSKKFTEMNVALPHCASQHNFSFELLYNQNKMDCYDFIKIINFIRTTVPSSPSELMNCDKKVWDNDLYLKPVVPNDPWLIYDFEDHFGSLDKDCIGSEGDKQVIDTGYDKCYGSKGNCRQLSEKDAIIESLLETINKMKMQIQNVLLDDSSEEACGNINPTLNTDTAYFTSYNSPEIHQEMLMDTVRTEKYREAIKCCNLKGKTVLDVGCGTGILSLFAAEAGASKVYAVDNSDIIINATDIVHENGFTNVIHVVKGCIEDENLIPDERVDVIVSEWMGYFLFFEGMLDSVIDARKKYLKPDGEMLPSCCRLYLCAANDPDGHHRHLGFWSNVYGYRMSCMKNMVVDQACVTIVPAECVVTSESVLLHLLDINKDNKLDGFSTTFSMKIDCKEPHTQVTSFVGYFDVDFVNQNVSFSTGPRSDPTHWKQTVFFLPEPIPVQNGASIDGNFECRRSENDQRALDIFLTVNQKQFVYHLMR